jgi:hypothetical protein
MGREAQDYKNIFEPRLISFKWVLHCYASSPPSFTIAQAIP